MHSDVPFQMLDSNSGLSFREDQPQPLESALPQTTAQPHALRLQRQETLQYPALNSTVYSEALFVVCSWRNSVLLSGKQSTILNCLKLLAEIVIAVICYLTE